MNLTSWIVAGLLAAVFLASGGRKVVESREKMLAGGTDTVRMFGVTGIRAIGVLEVLAAVGLILPAALGIAPVLVPLAAVGVAVLMFGAMVIHLRGREAQGVVVTLVLLALAVFVAWTRFGPQSFTS